MKLGLETDAVDVVKEMIIAARKGAKLALIGDYFNYTNGFPIGPFMEKGLSMAGGQLWCQKYWRHLLSLISSGDLDMTFLFSHRYHFNDISDAYKTFAHHYDNCTKVIVKTDYGVQQDTQKGLTASSQFGKITQSHKPPISAASNPIHLRDTIGQHVGGEQLQKTLGTSGGVHSVAAQGGTQSNMGTSVAGSMLGAQGSQMGVGTVHQNIQ